MLDLAILFFFIFIVHLHFSPIFLSFTFPSKSSEIKRMRLVEHDSILFADVRFS